MPRIKDITGQVYGRLIAISMVDKSFIGRECIWLCKCICGKETQVKQSNLRSGNTRSCGCLREESRKRKRDLMKKISLGWIE